MGAVRPLDAPSWFAAEPRITASTRWPCRRASDSRSTTIMPAPSAQPVPLASAENARQRPSDARPCCRENSMKLPGLTRTVTPPASAIEHSPDRIAWHAR